MFKKVLSLLFMIIFVIGAFSIVPLNASAADTEAAGTAMKSGMTGDCTWTLDDNGVLTVSGNGRMKDYGVDPIREGAPWGRDSIKEVIIENGVTHIGKCAFYDSNKLYSVSIGNTVESIGNCAFEFCYKLTSVSFPDTLVTIGGSAFDWCDIQELIIPASVTTIGISAFSNCLGLTQVIILNPSVDIGNLAIDRGTIYGYAGSTAQVYAEDNSLSFQPINGYCPSCGFLYSEDDVLVCKGKSPSYFHTGLTQGTKCAICGTWLIKQKEIPVLIGEGIFCDVDNNGFVSVVDATYIQRKIVKIDLPFEMIDAMGDADEDGRLTVVDTTLIQRSIAGYQFDSNIGREIGG